MIKKIFFTKLLLLLGFNGLATPVYQFELIVFSHINNSSYNSEQWPPIEMLPFNLEQLTPVEMLAADHFLLKNEQENLNERSPYKTLAHLAWCQSATQLDKPAKIHLYGGRLFDDEGNTLQTLSDQSIPYSNEQNWEMNGTITIDLTRYFELDINLLFALPYQQIKQYQHNDNQALFSYVSLKQHRRTKSKELNYIDHPLYGMLFIVNPTEDSSC